MAVDVHGQIPPLEQTLSGLRIGLLISIVVIFLLLTANFQSFRLVFTVVSTIPAVLCGVLLILLATGTTLNVRKRKPNLSPHRQPMRISRMRRARQAQSAAS